MKHLQKVLCLLFALSAIIMAPLRAESVPHCSPDCAACPSCTFCGQDCTLTQGYWKNHTECWPAEFDPGTQAICSLLWIDILNSPVKGRPWYDLAHQWIAAMLNGANGVDTSCIDCTGCMEECRDVLATVEALLTASCDDKDSKQPNALFNCFAMLLDDFNNGQIETCPAHCGNSNPCDSCDCGFCCPMDCSQIADCPNLCDVCQAADCPNRCDGCPVVCPNPCAPCPDCVCPTCPTCPHCPTCPDCICQECPPCECHCTGVHKIECEKPEHHSEHSHHSHHSSSSSSSSHHHKSHHHNKKHTDKKNKPKKGNKKSHK